MKLYFKEFHYSTSFSLSIISFSKANLDNIGHLSEQAAVPLFKV